MEIKSKSIKNLKKLEKEFHNTFNGLYKKIKKELVIEKSKIKGELIKLICQEYDLDYNELYSKYVTEGEIPIDSNLIIKKEDASQENVLDEIIIDGKECYLDDKGSVFNDSAIKIGRMEEEKFIPL